MDVLVGAFDVKIVNLCFCYENGEALNIGIHNKPSKKVSEELRKLLSDI